LRGQLVLGFSKLMFFYREGRREAKGMGKYGSPLILALSPVYWGKETESRFKVRGFLITSMA